MWIFTTAGFFSIVAKPDDDGTLTIRARAARDLDRLRDQFLPELGATIAHAGTDYPYRAKAPRAAVAAAISKLVTAVEYDNFKNAIAKVDGSERAHVYANVWTALLALEKEAPTEQDHRSDATRWSYGGVVVDHEGRVLLRKPAGGFGGYSWTFPKGKPDPGETPEQAALREVREETGVEVEIVEPIVGEFRGTTGSTRYWLMRPVRELAAGSCDRETEEVRWVAFEEAKALFGETPNPVGRERDLAVVEAARRIVGR